MLLPDRMTTGRSADSRRSISDCASRRTRLRLRRRSRHARRRRRRVGPGTSGAGASAAQCSRRSVILPGYEPSACGDLA